MPYLITNHARERIEERNISAEAIAATLDEDHALRRDQDDGNTLWYRAGVVVITDEAAGHLVTAHRVRRAWPKRMFGRGP